VWKWERTSEQRIGVDAARVPKVMMAAKRDEKARCRILVLVGVVVVVLPIRWVGLVGTGGGAGV
jgi:hypothetical protein